MKTKTIILLVAGGFIAYNIIVVLYALTMKQGLERMYFVSVWAPWLFISKSFANWLWKA